MTITLSHTSITARLRIGFLAVLASLLVVAATGLYEMSRANEATTYIVQINMKKIELLDQGRTGKTEKIGR